MLLLIVVCCFFTSISFVGVVSEIYVVRLQTTVAVDTEKTYASNEPASQKALRASCQG